MRRSIFAHRYRRNGAERHYGLLASASLKDNLALARRLLAILSEPEVPTSETPLDTCPPCPCCGGRMIVIETFALGSTMGVAEVTHAGPGTRIR